VEGTTPNSAQRFPAKCPQDAISEAVSLRQELQHVSHILLIRLRSLGDAILTLPLIEALNQWRPELNQSILIETPYAPVFQFHPAVNETLMLRSRKGFDPDGWTRFGAIMELRRRHFPAVLNLHGGTTSRLLTIASGARLRIGQISHRGSWLYNRRFPASSVIWNRQSLHTVENQLGIIRWLGLPIPSQPPTLYIGETSRIRIHQRLADAGISGYFLIQPTATLPTKQWKPECFAQIGDWLYRQYKLPVIYTAAPNEKQVLAGVRESALEQHIYWSDLPLMELFALIEKCRLFIGCDSGPTHAAAALKKPMAVVWGSSDFNAWHPWQTDYEAVRSELPCIPCPGYTCKEFGEPKCILEIPVSRIMEACRKIIDHSNG
jgi:heptosyltransferase III